eukprot:m.973415 g.973415  ORF g.973415 m.973415 type:complete len:89 (-) comp23935_c2_seq7:364-630(-)
MRGCPLRGLAGCATLGDQMKRFHTCGWEPRAAIDMNQVYAKLSPAERSRIQKLEIFDEVEEWHLINAHYCISTAFKDPSAIGLDGMPI